MTQRPGEDVCFESLTQHLAQIFFQTLSSFPNIAIYANAINDRSSPYATSAIELEDPFLEYQYNGIRMSVKFTPDWLLAMLC